MKKTKKQRQVQALRTNYRKNLLVPSEDQIKILARQFEQGDFAGVVVGAKKIADQYPDYGFIWKVLGAAYQKLGRLDDALDCKIKSTQLSPYDVEALINLGNAYNQLARYREAEIVYNKSLLLKPDNPDALSALGNVLNAQGRYDEAEVCCNKAILHNPKLATAYNNLGLSKYGKAQYGESIECYQKAIYFNPDYAGAFQNLAAVLRNSGHLALAEKYVRRAIEIDDSLAEAFDNLSGILSLQGRNFEALEYSRRAVMLKPRSTSFHSNLLFSLAHIEDVRPEEVLGEHVLFGQKFEQPLKSGWLSHENDSDPNRRLRVGFASGDLWGHPVSRFLLPVWSVLDRGTIEIWVYSNSSKVDAVTEKLRSYAHTWRQVHTLTDEALAAQIRSDKIDVLIDLSGHTADNRLMAFARKPAPIQATWIGNPNTTGLTAVDYVITDEGLSPFGLYEHYWVEKFVRIPSTAPFYAGEDSPPVNELPALSNKFITFASFNRANKIGDTVIETWSRVLSEIPGSRMMLCGISDDQVKESFVERFARNGIESGRLEFRPRVPTQAYLLQHNEVDIVLDTWPYNGGTTTNHALHMGVPVLTLRGPSMSHCVSACLLRQVGLEGWVADSVEEFVSLAKQKATDLQALATLRAELRERSLSSPLRKPETVARGFEKALRTMWQRWCEGLPPEHMVVNSTGDVSTDKLETGQ